MAKVICCFISTSHNFRQIAVVCPVKRKRCAHPSRAERSVSFLSDDVADPHTASYSLRMCEALGIIDRSVSMA